MRNPKPWFRAANSTGYFGIDGTQIKLGKNAKAANEKLRAAMRNGAVVDYTTRNCFERTGSARRST
jgi:hypothetical protein